MKTFRLKAVSIFIALTLTALMLTGCINGTKEPVSTVDFEALATQRGYIVQDATDHFAAYDYIKLATLTAPQDKAFQIEFYELNDSAVAKSFYDSNKNNFIMMKGSEADEESKSGTNYDIYKLEMYGKFMMIERVNDTVIYVNSTDAANRKTIESFIKEIGY